jgi:hypothetical protein
MFMVFSMVDCLDNEIHSDLGTALDEAKVLGLKYPKETFLVLESVAAIQQHEVTIPERAK